MFNPCLKNQTHRNKSYLQWIRSKGCVICGRPAIAHHEVITNKGTGIKGSDYETLPLCPTTALNRIGCHESRHRIGKLTFWGNHFGCVIDDFAGKGKIDFLIAKLIIGYLSEYLSLCRKRR